LFSTNFPEQVQFDTLLPGEYLTASFTDKEIVDFQIDGSIIQTTPLTDYGRGVYRLGNGNLLSSNAQGVWEIQPGTGVQINQKKAGQGRFIEYVLFGNQPPNTPSNPSPPDNATYVDPEHGNMIFFWDFGKESAKDYVCSKNQVPC